MKKSNIPKEFLIQEYIIKKMTTIKIAKKIKCSNATIRNYLIKYKISRRTISEACKGKNIGNKNAYIDGRKNKIHYCIICKVNKITYQTWKYGIGMCAFCAKRGKNHWHWQGGITPLGLSIKKLPEYGNWRNEVFKRDSYTCQDCGQIGKKLNPHHKIRFAELLKEFLNEYNQFSPIEDNETLIRLAMKWQPFWEVSNGKTLCEDCHKKTLNYGRLKKN